MIDSRANLRLDIGFYMGIILKPLVKSLYTVHALLACQ